MQETINSTLRTTDYRNSGSEGVAGQYPFLFVIFMNHWAYFLLSAGVRRESLRAEVRCHFRGAPHPGRPHGHQSIFASSDSRDGNYVVYMST